MKNLRVTRLCVLGAAAMLFVACAGGDGDEPAAPDAEQEDVEDDAAEQDEPEDAADPEPEAEDWPTESLRFIIPANEGGGIDGTARRMIPALEAELGVSIEFENNGGASTSIGTTQFLREVPADCSGLLLGFQPSIFFHPEFFGVDYTWEQLYPIGIPSANAGIWRVANDAPWETFEEFVEDARNRPGEIIAANPSAGISAEFIAARQLEEAAEIDLNIVAFDGGAEGRNAVIRGEADVVPTGVFNSLSAEADTRVLAVQAQENEWPDVTDNAPTVNDVLGLDLPTSSAEYFLATHRECAEDHPERFQVLRDAWVSAVTSEEFQAELEAVGAAGSMRVDITPEEIDEEYRATNEVALDALERFGDELN